MSKKVIPSIHVPIQEQNGSVAWVWYMFFQWIADNAGKVDLSDYYTKEEADELLSAKANTDDLKEVAFTGSYDDLSDKPTIPTVGDGTITLTQGGVTKGTFTTNQSGDTIIDLGSVVDIDDLTITMNADDEIQAEAVIDKNTGVLKHWSGTKAQYDAMPSHDSDTIYIITDDTDTMDIYTKTEVNTLLSTKANSADVYSKTATDNLIATMLENLYPVGSIYFGTQSACPLETLISGSTWELVATKIVVDNPSNIPVVGNGLNLGLTNGTQYRGLGGRADYGSLTLMESAYGAAVGTGYAGASLGSPNVYGVTTDPTKSGIVADMSSVATITTNVWRRTA